MANNFFSIRPQNYPYQFGMSAQTDPTYVDGFLNMFGGTGQDTYANPFNFGSTNYATQLADMQGQLAGLQDKFAGFSVANTAAANEQPTPQDPADRWGITNSLGLERNIDTAAGLASLASAGWGMYNDFQNMENARRNVRVGEGQLQLQRDNFDETLRRRQALVAQNQRA